MGAYMTVIAINNEIGGERVNYYNDHEPFAANWLKNLVAAGLLPPGDVDSRDIQEVTAHDLRGYTQCHFFCGIGGWPLALQLAGWPTTRPVWSGSCPCQPFSVAGKGKGVDDHRHLWPDFRRLIEVCRPEQVFGEQVASKDGRHWLSGVRLDLEALGYAVGAADLCAAGVKAEGSILLLGSDGIRETAVNLGPPHIRQRLFWVADAASAKPDSRELGLLSDSGSHSGPERDEERAANIGMADRDKLCIDGGRDIGTAGRVESTNSGGDGGLGNAIKQGLQGYAGNVADRDEPGRLGENANRSASTASGVSFSDFLIIPCGDGKARRLKPGLAPLVDAISGRVGLIRGYGNAICPEVAAGFIQAFMEVEA